MTATGWGVDQEYQNVPNHIPNTRPWFPDHFFFNFEHHPDHHLNNVKTFKIWSRLNRFMGVFIYTCSWIIRHLGRFKSPWSIQNYPVELKKIPVVHLHIKTYLWTKIIISDFPIFPLSHQKIHPQRENLGPRTGAAANMSCLVVASISILVAWFSPSSRGRVSVSSCGTKKAATLVV